MPDLLKSEVIQKKIVDMSLECSCPNIAESNTANKLVQICFKTDCDSMCAALCFAADYKQESQCVCRSELSRKSAENTLRGVSGTRGASVAVPSSFSLPMVRPNQSVLSSPSSSSSPMGAEGLSTMLGVQRSWLWRSSISVNMPPGSTPRRGFPVVLSRKSSRRPSAEHLGCCFSSVASANWMVSQLWGSVRNSRGDGEDKGGEKSGLGQSREGSEGGLTVVSERINKDHLKSSDLWISRTNASAFSDFRKSLNC